MARKTYVEKRTANVGSAKEINNFDTNQRRLNWHGKLWRTQLHTASWEAQPNNTYTTRRATTPLAHSRMLREDLAASGTG